jgi:hypothetical protein
MFQFRQIIFFLFICFFIIVQSSYSKDKKNGKKEGVDSHQKIQKPKVQNLKENKSLDQKDSEDSTAPTKKKPLKEEQ